MARLLDSLQTVYEGTWGLAGISPKGTMIHLVMWILAAVMATAFEHGEVRGGAGDVDIQTMLKSLV